jgi:DNA repair protein RadA/Sms
VRPVAHAPIRLKEAAKLGFASAFGPAGLEPEGGSDYRGLKLLPNLVDRIIGSA